MRAARALPGWACTQFLAFPAWATLILIDNRKEKKTHKKRKNAATQQLNGSRASGSKLLAATWAWKVNGVGRKKEDPKCQKPALGTCLTSALGHTVPGRIFTVALAPKRLNDFHKEPLLQHPSVPALKDSPVTGFHALLSLSLCPLRGALLAGQTAWNRPVPRAPCVLTTAEALLSFKGFPVTLLSVGSILGQTLWSPGRTCPSPTAKLGTLLTVCRWIPEQLGLQAYSSASTPFFEPASVAFLSSTQHNLPHSNLLSSTLPQLFPSSPPILHSPC